MFYNKKIRLTKETEKNKSFKNKTGLFFHSLGCFFAKELQKKKVKNKSFS